MQEYWRQKGAHSCLCTVQDIHEFFEWLANRLVHLKSGQKAFVKAQQYVAKLAKFQGYVSWDHRQDDHMHRLKVSMQRRQGVMTVITRPATNRNRFALTQQQLARLAEEVSWDKACADDTILLQQFVSTQTQTLKRPGHLLDTCRVNVKLTDPEEECLASVFGTLQFSEIGTAGAFHKLKSDADNFGYEIGTFKPSSLDPHAAHGARLIHDYLRMNDTGSSDGTVGGLAELIRTGTTGIYMWVCCNACHCMIYQHSSLLVAAKVVVPDGDDPLNREVEVAVPEWYLLPAMHGTQLRVASKDAPFRFVTPAELADSLLRPAFKEMEINLSKLGTKTMAPRQGSIKYLTEQHTGQCHKNRHQLKATGAFLQA
jgi:hypothetical protein